jgi:hypothetical protein
MDSFCCSVRKIKKSDFGKEDNFGNMMSWFLEIREAEDWDLWKT